MEHIHRFKRRLVGDESLKSCERIDKDQRFITVFDNVNNRAGLNAQLLLLIKYKVPNELVDLDYETPGDNTQLRLEHIIPTEADDKILEEYTSQKLSKIFQDHPSLVKAMVGDDGRLDWVPPNKRDLLRKGKAR
jgi:hypothetical protein